MQIISIILWRLRTLRVGTLSLHLGEEGELQGVEVEAMVEVMFEVEVEEMLVEMGELREVVAVHLEVYEVVEVGLEIVLGEVGEDGNYFFFLDFFVKSRNHLNSSRSSGIVHRIATKPIMKM